MPWSGEIPRVLAGLCALAWIGASALGLHFGFVPLVIAGSALLLAISWAYGVTARSVEVSVVAFYCAMWVILLAAAGVLSYVGTALGQPLCDAALVRFDAALGFDWLRWHAQVEGQRALHWLLLLAYLSGPFQIVAAVIYFGVTGQDGCNRELWFNATAAMLLTIVVAALFPAAGAYHYFRLDWHFAPQLPDFFAMRSGGPHQFVALQGLVSLPSYHTAQALLFIYAYRAQPRAFPWVVGLNLLMLLATPVMGGHYLADILAGAGVALAAMARQAVRPQPFTVQPRRRP
ncbi:MAG: phosphatase PAP2 family protein [Pseudomonadota bacterium]